MIKNIILLAFAIFLFQFKSVCFSNESQKSNNNNLNDSSESIIKKTKKDTVCYKLNYNQNDTLIYNIVSFDSISINYGKPVVKHRNDVLKIICDSVGENKHFYMELVLIYAHSSESSPGDTAAIDRFDNDWLGKSIFLEIDSVGKRYSFKYQNSIVPGLCPGGAFASTLFVPFKESCKTDGESWLGHDTLLLAENGYPIPIVDLTFLYRAKPSIDTLGEHCNRFEYIATGQGNMEVPQRIDSLKVTNILQIFGVMDLSSDKHILIHFFTTNEQKLTIHYTNEGVNEPGFHYSYSYYTLSKYKPGKKIEVNKKYKKKRKN